MAMKYNYRLVLPSLVQANLDAYIVPSGDEYNSGYVAPYAKRLAWLSGFTGSAGIAIIGPLQCYLLTDGRYLTQAAMEVEVDQWKIIDIQHHSLKSILEQYFPNSKVGYDPELFTIKKMEQILNNNNSYELVPSSGFVDELWKEQPARPKSEIIIYDDKLAGGTTQEKLAHITQSISELGGTALLTTNLTAVSWVLNKRAKFIEHTPVVMESLIILQDGTIHSFQGPHSPQLEQLVTNQKLLLDPTEVNYSWWQKLNELEVEIIQAPNPIFKAKAIKTEQEIAGFINIHKQDAITLSEGLAWIEEQMQSKVSKGSNITESDISLKLTELRSLQPDYFDLSFPAIVGADANSAIIHYHPTPGKDKAVRENSILLIDSGGHYLGGTTDVTRTIYLGRTPPLEMKQAYTRVLRGHIALATARFPAWVNGQMLDMLARQYLWKSGQDYPHSTGHGVGNMLSVHESPPTIGRCNTEPLLPGMVLSNEPGFYLPDGFGIRLENMQYVIESQYEGFLEFAALTLVPYDPVLISFEELSPSERTWLSEYHQRYKSEIYPQLSARAKKWADRILKSFV